MKNRYFILVALILLGLLSACDDDSGITNFAEGMEGIYRGNITVITGQEEDEVPCRVNIVRVDDENITLDIRDFSYKNVAYGDLQTRNIQANIEDGKYTLRGTSDVDVVINSRDSAVLLKVEGTISGTILRFTGDVVLADRTSVGVKFYGLKLDASSEAEVVEVNLTGAEKVNMIEKNIFFTMPLGTTDEDLKALTPEFKISQGATIAPATAQDFSAGKSVEYKVTSADKNVVTIYHAVCINGKYDFENWYVANPKVAAKSQFSEPVGYWGTSNAGLASVMGFVGAYTGGFNVTATEGNAGGKGVQIVTKNTIGSGAMVPKITSGTLFLGEFVTDINEPLNSTHFGIPVVRKPVSVSGWFKYTPGEDYYYCANPKTSKGTAVLDENKADSCAISVVLYQADYTLNGTNLLVDNENIIAKVVLPKNRTANTNGVFQMFSLRLDYGTHTFEADRKYKLAIVFASSKDGDKYSGAPGSTLVIDDVEITFE